MKSKPRSKNFKDELKNYEPDWMLLRELVDSYGVSGNEEEVRKLIKKKIKPHVNKIESDKYGSLICEEFCGKHKEKIMIVAHMDEVGLIVKHVSDKGSISFAPIGGIDPLALVGHRVLIRSKIPVSGVITTVYLSDGEQTLDLPVMEDLYIDTGLSTEELGSVGVKPGVFINLSPNESIINNRTIIGKALDDRIGCFILLEVARLLSKTESNVIYVFSTQEEVGLYGAATSSYKINPDKAIAVDVTQENSRSELSTKYLGKGPTITVKDAALISNETIVQELEETAEKNNINYQIDVSELGTTDATAIATSRTGVPTGVLGVAVRNIHSTMSIAHLDDIKSAIKLLYYLLRKKHAGKN